MPDSATSLSPVNCQSANASLYWESSETKYQNETRRTITPKIYRDLRRVTAIGSLSHNIRLVRVRQTGCQAGKADLFQTGSIYRCLISIPPSVIKDYNTAFSQKAFSLFQTSTSCTTINYDNIEQVRLLSNGRYIAFKGTAFPASPFAQNRQSRLPGTPQLEE